MFIFQPDFLSSDRAAPVATEVQIGERWNHEPRELGKIGTRKHTFPDTIRMGTDWPVNRPL
jgi:hypothetical protein